MTKLENGIIKYLNSCKCTCRDCTNRGHTKHCSLSEKGCNMKVLFSRASRRRTPSEKRIYVK